MEEQATVQVHIDVQKSRFRDASWFEKINALNTPIIIGGTGGIGSWVAVMLSRVLNRNHIIVLYDPDRIEEVNLAGQLFRQHRIGNYKVDEVYNLMRDFSGVRDTHAVRSEFDNNSFISSIIFSCYDNMKARKLTFNRWKNTVSKDNVPDDKCILIDGRLLAEQFQILFVTPDRADEYEQKYLFEDAEVEDANCSYKQTSHFAANIAAKMVQGFTNWIAGEPNILPFYYEEIGSLFYSKSDE